MSAVRVVAVIATHRRPQELARLLASLEKSEVPLHAVVVTDNAGDAETALVMQQSPLRHRLVKAGSNLGCGGGLRMAEEEALLEYSDLTHVWVLDDDVVVEFGTLGGLLSAMETGHVGAACAMPHDAAGKLGWYPGLVSRSKFKVHKRAATAAEYLERCGPAPEEFTWATGVSLLVGRTALEKGGLHRGDFWMRGEDLDFSLRITRAAGGVLAPGVPVAHLPPGAQAGFDFAERMKHAAMMQNCAYLAVHTRHGRALLKHWPGGVLRHMRYFGIGALGDMFRAGWLGAVRGLPAGAPHGDYFRRALNRS